MSVLENQLIDAAFRGEWAGPSKLPDLTSSTPLTPPQQAEITIDGAFLRKLLLDLVNSPANTQNPRMYGVRLRGAIIEGEIDLSDCTGRQGASLPPLLLEDCIIRNGDLAKRDIVCENTLAKQEIRRAINATNARLSRLSLNRCRVDGRIDLTGAKLDGDLEINDIAPLNSDCPCQIFARRCRINGSVIAKNAQLKIPAGLRTEFDVSDYALNLVNAEIRGSIMLQPDFRAEGGVDVRGARVSRDIWAEAATFIALDRIAFRAQSLQCDGVVALRGLKKKEAFCNVQGCLDFIGATIGYLDLRGVHIDKSPNENKGEQEKKELANKNYLLRLELARVKGDLRLDRRSETDETTKTVINGHIDAFNLRVGGDLTLHDLTTSIDLTSSHVERNLSVKNAIMKAPGDQKYGLLARNMTIGNDCDLDTVSGTVNLELSRIGGELKVYADNLAILNAKDAEVRGSVIISGTFYSIMEGPSLCFDGGKYLSGFSIGNCEFRQDSEKWSLKFLPSAFDPILSIENAYIENNFRVTEVKSEHAGPVTISLRGLKARVFHHRPEKSWADGIKLKLDGFQYERVDTKAFETKTSVKASTEKTKNWCECFWEFLCSVSVRSVEKESVKAYKHWLSLQESYKTADGHDPQPYEQLARALHNDGKYDDAKHITLEKLSLERKLLPCSSKKLFLGCMEKLKYGLFPRRSVCLFLFVWVAGGFAVCFSNYHSESGKPILVRHSIAASTLSLSTASLPAPKTDDRLAVGMKVSKPNEIAQERHCGEEVNSWWYALDVLIPLLNLKQEERCSITTRNYGYWWRFFEALYAICGAIITPIMLLSVTGMLRRYIER